MKKNSVFTLILSVFLLLNFNACDMFQQDESIEIKGQWTNQSEKASINSDSFIKYFYDDESESYQVAYECSIVEFSNDNFNAGEMGDADCGFAVIKYTKASSYTPQSQDKYGILRWQDFNGDTMNFSEGYFDPTGGNNPVYFETAVEAKATMTDANICFAYYSQVNKQ